MKRREFLKTAAAGTALASASAVGAQGVATPAQQEEFNAPLQINQPPYAVPAELGYQQGVPRGQVFNFEMHESRFFAGATRTISVYVPAQYRATEPACVMVMLDNLMVSPAICDNLIHQKEMPITIGIGLQSGALAPAVSGASARINRSFEFDSITPLLAEFILTELIPAVASHKTPSGLPILLSNRADDRAITGGSTGAIGAFNAAWQRPDAFHRVFAWSTTMVGMRGAGEYITLVRKTEPKPLRVFVLDGFRDEWWGGPQFGDWWLANLALQRALRYAGYDVNHVWGNWGHCDAPSINFFPEAIRWLWKGWPERIQTGVPGNSVIADIVIEGENWTPVLKAENVSKATPAQQAKTDSAGASRGFTCAVADSDGRLYVLSPTEGVIHRLQANGTWEVFAHIHPSSTCMVVDDADKLYVSEPGLNRIVVIEPSGHPHELVGHVHISSMTFAPGRSLYAVELDGGKDSEGTVWQITAAGAKREVLRCTGHFTVTAITPDKAWFFAAASNDHKAWSYRIEPDGELTDGEPFYWFHQPDAVGGSGIAQACFDKAGWGYAATRMGVQVFSTSGGEGGLVWAILPVHEEELTGICFGGANKQTLYACTRDQIFSRHVKATGVPA